MANENAPLIPKIHNKQHHPPVETVVLERNEGEEEEATTDYGSGNYPYPTYLQAGHFTSLEKLMFFVSSILLILLCVFVGLYARSAQNNKDVSSPIPLPPSHVGRNESKAQVIK
jgi:hypothetical protein